MTNSCLEECLGRLSLLRHFPSNPFAIKAVAEVLRETCPTDHSALSLTRRVLDDFDEWCGPRTLRRLREEIAKQEREAEWERARKERLRDNLRKRDEHEQSCPGYMIEANGEEMSIGVSFCVERFGELVEISPDGHRHHAPRCRKGDALQREDAEFCRRRLAQELAGRPGWVSRDEYWRMHYAHRKGRTADASPAKDGMVEGAHGVYE